MPDNYYEEEEFQSKFDGKTLKRILGLTRPHLKWVIGFLITIAMVAALDAVSTFISKRIIDDGIIAKNLLVLIKFLIDVRRAHPGSGWQCFSFHLPCRHSG